MLEIKQQVNLQAYTTMALPAVAHYFVEVDSVTALREAVRYAQQHAHPLCILGEGSNSLFVDDFVGMVIKVNLTGYDIIKEDSQTVTLACAAGENWDELVAYAVENNFYGIENLSLIPGTVGAAPVQNIGAYGVELAQVLAWVEVLDIHSLELKRLSLNECCLSYRDSIFKRDLKDQVVITQVALSLQKQQQFIVEYAALKTALTQSFGEDISQLSLQQVRQTVIDIRRAKLPAPEQLPNAGSFFKNPVVSLTQLQELKQQYPDLPNYSLDMQSCKLPAAWLIDQAGWKGKQYAGVAVHQQQALVLINKEGASGAELMQLAKDIQADILAKYTIHLEIEPRVYGRF